MDDNKPQPPQNPDFPVPPEPTPIPTDEPTVIAEPHTPTEKTSSPAKSFFKVLLGIALFALLAIILLFSFLNRQFNRALQPIQQFNASLSTQVSNLLNPTPTVIPDPISIVREVQTLARLETIQYSVEKIITAELNQGVLGPLFGDRLLFVAHGYVIAGVDLSNLTSNDLSIRNEILYVTLPDAEVFVATLSNEDSYVYDRETGILRRADTELESTARRVAEQEILRTATEDGILTQAQKNAEAYLLSLFNSVGYPRVIFE